jgi:hypothetical protein
MKWLGVALAGLALLLAAFVCFQAFWTNPRVVRELREHPDGVRARKVMLLTLPSGKSLPVNYLREGDAVYAAADFPWWRELGEEGGPGRVLILGETFRGHVRAVLDEPALRASVFERLRPTAPSWAGTLVVIDLDARDASRGDAPSGDSRPGA